MSANDLLIFANQTLYVLVFVVTLVHAVRYPRRTNVDIALLFGDAALIIGLGLLATSFHLTSVILTRIVPPAIAMALPYFLLRLVDDFSEIPPPVMRAAEVLLALFVIAFVVLPGPTPTWLILLLVLDFAGFEGYATITIVGEARRSVGLTRRRMQAIAAGSLFLAADVVVVGAEVLLPRSLAPGLGVLAAFCGFASGVSYFIGFATPPLLRRAWQAAALRSFLSTAPALAHLPTVQEVANAYQKGAAQAIGVPNARLGYWNKSTGMLRFVLDEVVRDVEPGEFIGGKAYDSQRPLFLEDASQLDPDHTEFYRLRGVNAALAAPVSIHGERLGVLIVYAPRAPIFAEDDLALVELLANQAAVVLENRLLIDELASSRAREEVTRLKDDFLSAAAHDLQTPLTTLIAQAQLLERRAIRSPDVPPDLDGIRRIVSESRRLNLLVRELLDVTRIERGQFLLTRDEIDLVKLALEAAERHTTEHHLCHVDAPEPVIGWFDETRIMQVIDNLIENAVKFSPEGGDVRVRLTADGKEADLSVSDTGIGIPPDDLPYVFDRFRRGTNVDDRRFAGMGLGLYIARSIVEQHGGQISATSGPGQGTTIHVRLPLTADETEGDGATPDVRISGR